MTDKLKYKLFINIAFLKQECLAWYLFFTKHITVKFSSQLYISEIGLLMSGKKKGQTSH